MPSSPAQTTTAGSPSALQAEAVSAATGDIPDNQVFLTFRNKSAGWSMQYPEGWAQSGSGSQLAFRDKNNIVRVVIAKGAIDTRNGKLLAKIPVGAGPHGLCVWPQPGRYSLGHTGILR